MSTLDTVSRLLHELQQEPLARGWATKWQTACELLWKLLKADMSSNVPGDHLEIFIKLLCEEDKFALARLVIADLRQVDINHDAYHPQQKQILESTVQLRRQHSRREAVTQDDFDDILAVAEKQAALDAELHRARVLLHSSGAFGNDNEEKLKEWLEGHPELFAKGVERSEEKEPSGGEDGA